MARTLRPEDGIRHLSDEELLTYQSTVQEHFSKHGATGALSFTLDGNELTFTVTIDTHVIAEVKGVLHCLNPDFLTHLRHRRSTQQTFTDACDQPGYVRADTGDCE